MKLQTKIAAATLAGLAGLAAIVAGCGSGEAVPAEKAITAAQPDFFYTTAQPFFFYVPGYVAAEHAREYESLVNKVHEALESYGYLLEVKEDGYEAYRYIFQITYSDGSERYYIEFDAGDQVTKHRVEQDGDVLSYAWVNGELGDISSIVSVRGLIGNPVLTTTDRTYDRVIAELRARMDTSFPVGKFISDLQSAAPYGAGRNFVVK